jgi:hypothetical protein
LSFKHNAEWFFVAEDPNDRVRSTTRRHALEGSNLNMVSRVVREAIQNSVDATLDNQKTSLLFYNQTLAGEISVRFKELLKLDAKGSPSERVKLLGLQSNNAFERLRMNPAQRVNVTIIEDWNTCGLGYDAKDGKDRFDELCLSFGQDSTWASGNRGGSYGFGKEVYEEASDCNTFLVYSVFEPCEETNGSHARLFGCSTFDGHIWDEERYRGRALFGVCSENRRGQTECRPLIDEQAHELARRLGFDARDREDYGTSIMIIGPHLNLDDVRSAVEMYWWPRILSNQLYVELRTGNEVARSPEPRENPKLMPYIDCYEMIEHDIPPKGRTGSEVVYRPRAISGRRLGQLALKGLETNSDEPEDIDEEDELSRRVALVRSGPKMVVQYMDPGGARSSNFAGTFVSHSDSEEALHLSEPPSHDSWNPNSQRLRDAYPNDEHEREIALKLVESVVSRVRVRARRFQRGLNPPQPPPTVTGTKRLAQILQRMMSGRGFGQSPPSRTADPFELRIRDGRTNSRSKSRVTANVEIKLKDDSDMDRANVIVTVSPSIVIDDDRRRDPTERLNLSSVKVNGRRVNTINDYDVSIEIDKSSPVMIEVQSAEFNRDLYACLDVMAYVPSTTISEKQ